MVRFKKAINFRVVSLFIAVIFLFTNTAYGVDLSGRTHIRNYLLGNSEEGEIRGKQALDVTSKTSLSNEETGGIPTVLTNSKGFRYSHMTSDLVWFGIGSLLVITIVFVNGLIFKPYFSYNWLIHGYLEDLLTVPVFVYPLTFVLLIGNRLFGKRAGWKWLSDKVGMNIHTWALGYGTALVIYFSGMEVISGILGPTNEFVAKSTGVKFDVYDVLSYAASYGILCLTLWIKIHFQGLWKEDSSKSPTQKIEAVQKETETPKDKSKDKDVEGDGKERIEKEPQKVDIEAIHSKEGQKAVQSGV